MATKQKKPRGYNKRSAREHPGVTISEEIRDGEKRILLRWREVLPGGRLGKRKGCYAVDASGELVASRTKAQWHAVRKASELKADRAALESTASTTEFQPSATWDELIEKHTAYLKRKGRSPKTISTYTQTWSYLRSWRGRPTLPKQLELADLESYAQHVANYKKQQTKAEVDQGVAASAMSPQSVRTVLVHFKALLNFGRKRLKCVRLDGETVAEGLQPTVKAQVNPVALSSEKLRTILEGAKKVKEGRLFPLIAFLMLTGCRLGEAEAVRWKPSKPGAAESWPDFAGGRLMIYGGKTSRQRVIPFETRPALKALLEAMKQEVDTNKFPYVFGGKLPLALRDKREVVVTDKDGTKLIGKSGKAILYETRRESGADWKVKDLRSTLATYMCNSSLGLNVYAVAGELGHDHAVLMKHYAGQYHLPPKQREAKSVEALLGVEAALKSWLATRGKHNGRRKK